MKKIVFSLLFATIGLVTTGAQQLPNSDFEDWSGATFNGQKQPKSWNASNVTQVGMEFNFAHQVAGHSGQYAMMVEDQEVGAVGITETSPGYFSLGTPWVYLESVLKVSEATAGDDGGIDWTHRPDTMAVWIKRVGDNALKEDFHLLYYSWRGTSTGTSFKGKNGKCTSVTKYNEESDIRQSTDRNECVTSVQATQVAEGWVYEKKRYDDWTLIKVPILYRSDEIPEKMNAIFSASNYPNFRANSGLYVGNQLHVDDIQLIYSSKIQHLYIDNKEWRGFDPNSTEEQVYSLGEHATEMPDIFAMRGEGSFVNSRNQVATFPGRRLQGNEIQITPGQIDGAPTVITVNAEDGSSSTTYRIKFVRKASSNASLASISINGTPIRNFTPAVTAYTVELPYGTTATPVVEVVGQEDTQTITVTQPTSLSSSATITVLAADKTSTKTYQVSFRVAALADNTLQDILINGQSVPGFTPSQLTYRVSLPLSTTSMPTVTAVSAYPEGEQTIRYTAPVQIDGGTYQIAVTTPGNPTPKTYKLNFRLEASSYSLLKDLQVGEGYITTFEPDQLTYYVTLPMGTTQAPAITYVPGDAYQQISAEPSLLDGTARITVTAGNGTDKTVYRVVFNTLKSDVSTLDAILLDGQPLEGFSPLQTSYTVSLPVGTSALPAISVVLGDEYQTYMIMQGGLNGVTRISVSAGDGSTTIYQLTFTVEQATDASLEMIYLDGQPLANYDKETLEYWVNLEQGTTVLPEITYQAHDEHQMITTRSGGINGDYKLTVRPQSGASRTYIIHFSVKMSSNTALGMIYLNNEPLSGFDPEQLTYVDTLPEGVSTIPAITFDKQETTQKVMTLSEKTTCTLKVTAESGASRTYTLTFVIRKSETAFLRMIYLNGDSLPGFDPQVLSYDSIVWTLDTIPTITVDKYDGQHVMIVSPYRTGAATITVTPEAGAANVYTVQLVDTTQEERPQLDTLPAYIPSSSVTLRDIQLNGEHWAEFMPAQHYYELTLPAGSSMPSVSFVPEDKQSVISGPVAPDMFAAYVTAENGDTAIYSVHIVIEPYTNVYLDTLWLEGINLPFKEQQFIYRMTIDEGELLPTVHYISRPGQNVILSEVTDSIQRLDVFTAHGDSATYLIKYTRAKSSNALLADILLDGVSLRDFEPERFDYVDTLPQGTLTVPCVYAVPQRSNQVITTYFSAVGGVTVIQVEASDGTTAEYHIAFPVILSDCTTLKAVDIDEALDFFYNPQDTIYEIHLPYGTQQSPVLYYEKQEKEQTVEYIHRPLHQPSELIVTAPDGSMRTYRFIFHVLDPQEDNTLLALSVNGEDIPLQEGISRYTISLPYDTHTMDVQYTKRYDEQSVHVLAGGVTQPTIVTVYSSDTTAAPVVYTLVPEVQCDYTATLEGITVDGEPCLDFRPNKYRYVINVDHTPSLSYVAKEGTSVEEVESDSKHILWRVTEGTKTRDYAVWFYYVNDQIPSNNFLEWDATKYNNKSKPAGWSVPADCADEYTWTFLKTTTGQEVTALAGGGVHLSTWRDGDANAIYGSVPGIMTIGTLHLSLASTGNSSSSVSGGILYRNTPDQVYVEYRPVSASNMNNWRMWVELGDGSNTAQTLYEGAYSNLNQWQNVTRDLNYTGLSVVSSLNITLNSAHSDNAGDLGGITKRTADLDIRNLRFIHNSRLAAVNVENGEAQITGTDISATLTDPEYDHLPELLFTGEKADQTEQVLWSEEQAGIRTAQVYNIAEDGSYTTYNLTLTRPLSTVNTLTSLMVNGETVPGFTPSDTDYTLTLAPDFMRRPDIMVVRGGQRQQVTMAYTDSLVTVHVLPEQGEEKLYTLHLIRPITEEIHTIDRYNPETVTSGELAEISEDGRMFVRRDWQDSVVFVQTEHRLEWHVYGTTQHDYSRDIATPIVTQDPGIWVNGQPLEGFLPQITEYTLFTDTTVQVYIYGNQPYNVYVKPTQSQDARLSALLMNGEILLDFATDTFAYTITLPTETPKTHQPILPCLQFVPVDAKATAEITPGGLNEPVYVDVLASDGWSRAQYTVTFVAEPGHDASLAAIAVNGCPLPSFEPARTFYSSLISTDEVDITWLSQDRFQTVELTSHDNIYVLHVEAEDKVTTRDYTIEFYRQAPSNDATLEAIMLDGVLVESFSPMQNTYTIALPYGNRQLPQVNAFMHHEGQTIRVMQENDTVAIRVTAEDGVTANTYHVYFERPLSSNALLNGLFLDGEALPDFMARRFYYTIDLPVGRTTLPEIVAAKAEADQRVSDVVWNGNEAQIRVTAEDGHTTAEYLIMFRFLKSDADTLLALYQDGMMVPSFQPTIFYYHNDLPVGTVAFPEISWECADMYQQVTCDTVENTALHRTCLYNVVAQSGRKNVYTVVYDIALSSVDTLQMIYVDNKPLPDFAAQLSDYSCTVPAQSVIPDVFWVEGDAYQTVTMAMVPDSLTAHSIGQKVEITVRSQQGTQRLYTIHFPVQLSSDAALNMIFLGGQNMTGYDEGVTDYHITLPYGTTQLPNVTVAKKDDTQRVDIEAVGDNIIHIDVTAEDGTKQRYTLSFAIGLSDNDYLQSLTVNDRTLETFQPSLTDYNLTVPYGESLPHLAWKLAEAEQSVSVDTLDITVNNSRTVTYILSVLAPDGEHTRDYSVHFAFRRNSNAYLSSLFVRGEQPTMAGGWSSDFHRDTMTYACMYAIGSTEDVYFTASDVTFVCEDSLSTVLVTEVADHGIQLLVTAADGEHTQVYTLSQAISRSANANIAAVYFDGDSFAAFDPSVTEYTYLLLPGASAPQVTFEAEDSLATAYPVTPGVVDSLPWTLICESQDEAHTQMYHITFRHASGRVHEMSERDVLVQPVLGTNEVIAASLAENVYFAVYDMSGVMLMCEKLPVCDPNNAVTGTDASGKVRFLQVRDTDECLHFSLEKTRTYLYAFLVNGSTRIASGKLTRTK